MSDKSTQPDRSPKMVQLRTGVEAMESLVRVVMLCLDNLLASDPVAFYELVMKARDRNHRIFGTSAERLHRQRLLGDDQQVHAATRDIILAAVTGDGLGMVLISPYAETA